MKGLKSKIAALGLVGALSASPALADNKIGCKEFPPNSRSSRINLKFEARDFIERISPKYGKPTSISSIRYVFPLKSTTGYVGIRVKAERYNMRIMKVDPLFNRMRIEGTIEGKPYEESFFRGGKC
jgi:hypothetical protein